MADKQLLASDNDGLNKSFLAADDVELFVRRYRLYRQHLYGTSDRRVLHLRFEDLVLNYDTTAARILNFLDLRPEQHASPRTTFNPEQSQKNVGIWRSYSKQKEIRFIEAELGEYLVNE